MIKVFLCDDHALVRRGIRDTLSDAVDITVTADVGSYAELREAPVSGNEWSPPCVAVARLRRAVFYDRTRGEGG